MFDLDIAVLKDIFNFTSDGIFILDKDWKIVAMNDAARVISGWGKSEVESTRLCTELFLCYDMEGNQLCDNGCPKQSVLSTHKPSNQVEVKIMTKSRHPVILPGLCALIPSEGDSLYAAILVKNELEKRSLEEKIIARERLDPLTQIYHRQYFESLYNIEAKRAQRHGGEMTLLMLDVDKLREINSELGHRTGDEVLKGIGNVVKKTIREVDVAGRYGDDEYVILLYGVDEIKAQSFIQRLRDKVLKFNQTGKLSVQVKLNMCLMASNKDFDTLLERIKEVIDNHQGIPL